MKITVRAASDAVDSVESVAEVVSNVADVVKSFFVDQYGMDDDEADESYSVSMEPAGDGSYRISVNAEFGYDEFAQIAAKLNEALAEVDSEAYFDAEQPGIFSAVVNTKSSSDTEQDPVFNEKNVRSAVVSVLKQLSAKLGEQFSVEDLFIQDNSVLYDEEDDMDPDLVRIFVEAVSDSYQTMAYVDLYRFDTFSVAQMKADLSDELYSKLMNAVVPKESE